MAWLREIELEFVDIIVMSDNEPALTSFDRIMEHIEEWIEDDHQESFCWKIEEQGGR